MAELNARAQAHLHDGVRPTRTVALADGSDAAVGDVIITRLNDRRLRTSGTDWVRNGDRWTITGIATNGDLRAIHQTSRWWSSAGSSLRAIMPVSFAVRRR